ncbi:metallophosphoesterase [Luteimonas sp. A478]
MSGSISDRPRLLEQTTASVRASAPAVLALALLLGGWAGNTYAREAAAVANDAGPVRIAFMPDVHFHDVYATFADGSFPGVRNPINGRQATIRTMQAQVTSTRLFNENYFAFLAALDDAVARGVRLIALPGDFSDDGQPVHLRELAQIMDGYSRRHGVRFFVVPGNHDPVRPFDHAGGKPDFLGTDPTGESGVPQGLYSRGGNDDCSTPWPGEWARVGDSWCTDEIRMLGYAGITAAMAGYGFTPQLTDRYYETPYSDYSYAGYDYSTALEQADWSRRIHRICSSVNAPGDCQTVPDASYLVEPVDGLWLVGLDAAVYVPTGSGPGDFTGSGNQGYNAVLRHKPHVIDWLADVVARGEALGKQVIAFSHFPMAEFFNGASDDIASLMGERAMQLVRRPADDTTRALAGTGLRLHVGGHMHIGDVAVHDSGDGNVLFNIQAPSLAAYAPGYTLMTLQDNSQVEVETVRLDQVPRFDELFPLYRVEHGRGAQWDVSILDAADYGDFVSRYLRELVRLRLLDDDWPCDMREMVRSPLTGADLLVFSQLRTGVTLAGLEQVEGSGGLSAAFFACHPRALLNGKITRTGPFAADLAAARARAADLTQAHGLQLEELASWSAMELAIDFVRLANAGELAFDDIPTARLEHYRILAEALRRAPPATPTGHAHEDNVGDLFRARFGALIRIMAKLAQGAPSRHFRIDLDRGLIEDLSRQSTEKT